MSGHSIAGIATNKAFDGWEDMAYNILESFAVLSDADNIDKLYAVLDDKHEKLSKKEFASYHLEVMRRQLIQGYRNGVICYLKSMIRR